MDVIAEKYTSQRSTDTHPSLALLTKLQYNHELNQCTYFYDKNVYTVSNICTDIHMYINTHTLLCVW